jgi:uncharacterized glyoxalase superfamily protein PhnB
MSAIGFISPALFYQNADAAIAFLVAAFGFRSRHVSRDEQGAVLHAELTFRDSVIMVGSENLTRRWRSPLSLGGVTQSFSVVVEDADAHFARARAAGAQIVREPQDEPYGGRGYEALDQENNWWYFGTYVPGEWWDGNTPSQL